MSLLGIKLEKNRKLHKFFVSISDDGNNVKWCKLNRNLLKNHLIIRYGKKITDRILLFLDTNFGLVVRLQYEIFTKMIKDFIRGSFSLWRKFAYFVFNVSGNEKLCEHDLF
jgi:hypothetical protein